METFRFKKNLVTITENNLRRCLKKTYYSSLVSFIQNINCGLLFCVQIY